MLQTIMRDMNQLKLDAKAGEYKNTLKKIRIISKDLHEIDSS